MPLQFANQAAEICFWIFFVLFFASAAVWAGFVLRGKFRAGGFLKPLPLLCWGTALACLAPGEPLVYFAVFLIAAGEACGAFDEKFHLALPVGKIILFAAAVLQLVLVGELFADRVGMPRPFLWLLAAVFAAAGGGAAAGCLSRGKKDGKTLIFQTADVLYLAAETGLFVFSVALFAAQILYSTLFVLLGAAFLAAGEIFSRCAAEKLGQKKRALYPRLPFFIGQILLTLGMILSLAAALIG